MLRKTLNAAAITEMVVFTSFVYGLSYYLSRPPELLIGGNAGSVLTTLIRFLLLAGGLFFTVYCRDDLHAILSKMGIQICFSFLGMLAMLAITALLTEINHLVGPVLFLYRICLILLYAVSVFFTGCNIAEYSDENKPQAIFVASLLHTVTIWGLIKGLFYEHLFEGFNVDTIGYLFVGYTIIMFFELYLLFKNA